MAVSDTATVLCGVSVLAPETHTHTHTAQARVATHASSAVPEHLAGLRAPHPSKKRSVDEGRGASRQVAHLPSFAARLLRYAAPSWPASQTPTPLGR